MNLELNKGQRLVVLSALRLYAAECAEAASRAYRGNDAQEHRAWLKRSDAALDLAAVIEKGLP